ncbi:hypothetical protein AB0P32_32910 [Streptomyces sp. NPDC085995]|uniref:hypothetical protein n=1 Tax=Streptomyces sp. NPDC085995 TaxID=3154861 RepID=UPI00342BC76B
MADTTSHAAGGGDNPPPDKDADPAGGASAGRVRFSLTRWALAPRTTWQARRLAAEFGPGMDADTAWVMARLARHPEERGYAMRHLGKER